MDHDLTIAAREAHALAQSWPDINCDSHCRFLRPPEDPAGQWSCFACGRPIDNIAPELIQAEIEAAAAAREQDRLDRADAASLYARGVTVAYLNAFTDMHDCWDWPTWRVVRDIIKPQTTLTRQRFADFLRETEPTVVGPPSVFVSHSWAAKWGVLVAAASKGCDDGTRRVWVDVLAVRQWDGNEADLDFRRVVQRCRVVVLPISHEIFQESSLSENTRSLASASRTFKEMFESRTRAKLPLSGVWCLAEIVAAFLAGKAVIVTAGLTYRTRDELDDPLVRLPPARKFVACGRHKYGSTTKTLQV